MSALSPKKKNVYLDRINESLLSFFRTLDKFDQNLNELSQLVRVAAVHINDMERILGNNEDDDEEDNEEPETISENEREVMVKEKLCELNDDLNGSIHDIQSSWNTLEKEGASLGKTIVQLPKLIRLFLDTTKADVDFNDAHFRSEITQLSEQFPIVGQFYYELCLELQTNFLDLSSMKSVKHLATILEFMPSRSLSISVPLQIIRQIQAKLT